MKKYTPILLLFTVLITLIVAGCSIDSSASHKNNSLDKKQEFRFNEEQLKFLRTLGIYGVSEAEDFGSYKIFKFAGDTFEIYTDDKNDITKIFYGRKTPNKLFWNLKRGKIGLVRSERLAFLNNFVEKAHKRYDQARQITWIDQVKSRAFGHKGIYTYMGMSGKELTGEKWLRIQLHYSDEDWVFFRKVIFSNTNETWTYVIPNPLNIRRDVVYGGIHEVYDAPLNELKRGLEIITSGENPRIDFIGDHYRDGKNLNGYDIKNAKTYLLLQEIIEEEFN